MKTRWTQRWIACAIALGSVLFAFPLTEAGQGGGGNSRGAANGPARGRGGAAQPAPLLADGKTVNLGRVPGEKGYWNPPFVMNMASAQYVVGAAMSGLPGGGATGLTLGLPGPAGPVPPNTGRGVTVPGAAVAPARGARGLEPFTPTTGGAAGGAAALPPLASGAARGGRGGGGRGSTSEPWIPFQPWAAAVYDYNVANNSKYDPEASCLPSGGPRLMATPYPMEIIQLPEQNRVLMIYEGAARIWREIHMEPGRKHGGPGSPKSETWLGDSIGRYEDDGKTLVVDVVGFNEGTWLDFAGHPHTNLLRIVERFSRPDRNTLHYEATIDDPGAYTRPWSVQWDIPWVANGELSESICLDKSRTNAGLKDDFGQPVFEN